MNMARLDQQDTENFGATRKAEGKILSDLRWVSITAYVIGLAIGIFLANTIGKVGLLGSILVFVISISLVCILAWGIKTAMRNVRTEFRKLEGFISISTLRLAQELQAESEKQETED